LVISVSCFQKGPSAFKLYVQQEAKKYEPQFDDALYAQWYRLYDIPREAMAL
jgi:hypothetical protein